MEKDLELLFVIFILRLKMNFQERKTILSYRTKGRAESSIQIQFYLILIVEDITLI